MRANLPDGFIKPFDHRMVAGRLWRGRPIAILSEQTFRRRVRVMRQHRRIPSEERLTVFFRTGDELREWSQSLAADIEANVAMPPSLRHALGEPARGVVAHPPLTRLQAHVALLTQQAWEMRGLLEEFDHLGAALEERRALLSRRWGHGGGHKRVVAGDAMAMDVPAGQDGGEAGAAKGIRDIAAREDARLGRQFIEVGRADRLRAHEPIIKPSMIVRDDHEDVGRLRRSRRCGADHSEGAQQEEEMSHRKGLPNFDAILRVEPHTIAGLGAEDLVEGVHVA